MLRALPCLTAAAAVMVLLTACGGPTSARVTGVATPAAHQLTPSQAHPVAPVAAATLSRIASVTPALTRIGFVNVSALDTLDAPLPAGAIARLVLGRDAPPSGEAHGTITRIGAATVIDGRGRRIVRGGDEALRRQLAITAPTSSVITKETPSAAQSCVGDPAVETMIGPAVLGTKSAMAVGLRDDADAPAGPKLLICGAPHYRRDLGRIERRLRERFDDPALPAGRRPVIGLVDIGERDVVRAVVALDTVDEAVLRSLLAGGPALVALAGR